MPDTNDAPIPAGAPEAEAEAGRRRSRGPAINRVELLGRLTADPNLHYSQDGRLLAGLRLATNERQEPEFHQLTAFGKEAEFAGEYLRTGRLVLVQGRLTTQSWYDRTTGEKRYTTKILVNNIQALDRPRQESTEAPQPVIEPEEEWEPKHDWELQPEPEPPAQQAQAAHHSPTSAGSHARRVGFTYQAPASGHEPPRQVP